MFQNLMGMGGGVFYKTSSLKRFHVTIHDIQISFRGAELFQHFYVSLNYELRYVLVEVIYGVCWLSQGFHLLKVSSRNKTSE